MMHLQRLSIATAIVAAMLQLATPSHAAGHSRDILGSVGDAFDSVRDFLLSPFDGGPVVEPPTPMDFIHGAQRDSPFWDNLIDAGYALKKIDTYVGLIPGLEFDFILVRELSEADRDALERKLEIDAKQNGNITDMVRRQIIRTLIEASDFEDTRIAEVILSILPLPSVTFKMEPTEAPLGEEHDAIFRVVQELRHQMRERAGEP